WRTCTGPTASAAPPPARSRSSPPGEANGAARNAGDMSKAAPHAPPLPSGERSAAQRPGEGGPTYRGSGSPSPQPSPRRGEGAGRAQPRRWHFFLAALLALIVGAASLGIWVLSLGPAPDGRDVAYSALVVDREGRLLRPYPTLEGRWRLPVA